MFRVSVACTRDDLSALLHAREEMKAMLGR